MSGLSPQAFSRRSFLYHKLLEQGASFVEIAGTAVAASFGDLSGELERVGLLGLSDLSPLRRCGFKGAGAVEWLSTQGLSVPEASNRAEVQYDGSVAARLGPGEVLILGDLRQQGDLAGRLEQDWQGMDKVADAPHGYPVPRRDSHAWFYLTGSRAAEALAKLCAVDLRPNRFGPLQIAQTSVARISAIVLRQDCGAVLGYHLLVDSASAEYFWDCLLDAMQEFGGGPVGMSALKELL